MPTDSLLPDPHQFDADAARDASLAATLLRVRLCRRVRRGAGASAALLVAAAALWLAMPAMDPMPDQHLTANPLMVRSIPLAAGQRIVSSSEPGLFIPAPAKQAAPVRVTTPPDVAVPRLGEVEFHSWLAAHELYCIQLAGHFPQVLPLRPR